MPNPLSKDPYVLLGVTQDATVEQLNDAWKKQAKKWHPDLNPSPEAASQFAEITRAYRMLLVTHQHIETTEAAEVPKREQKEKLNPLLLPLHEPFKARNGPPRKGDDVDNYLTLPLKEALPGTTKLIAISYLVPCPECRGSKLNSQNMACQTCEKTGSVMESSQIEVTLPPTSGPRTVTLTRRGGPGWGGQPSGDLRIHITPLDDPWWVVSGNDLTCELMVDMTHLVNGASWNIPHPLQGSVRITLPPSSRDQNVLKLPDKGLLDELGQIGDGWVKFTLRNHDRNDSATLEALEALREAQSKRWGNLPQDFLEAPTDTL